MDLKVWHLANVHLYVREVDTLFKDLLEEYFNEDRDITESADRIRSLETHADVFSLKEEEEAVADFLAKPCPCSQNCQSKLNYDEVAGSRAFFRSLEKNVKNMILLIQLKSLLSHSKCSVSARSKKTRKRKKFDYRISIDRPVCKTVFLFYYGETSKRLDRLKSHVGQNSVTVPVRGNSGRTPANAYQMSEREQAKSFIVNFTSINGLPDPGRDVRKGKGKLRILLPSIMSHRSVHQQYVLNCRACGNSSIGYRTFLKIWREEFPHIRFNNPKTDLCMTCEDFKKRLNQAASALDENREKQKVRIHKEALRHLNQVKKERLFYKANSKTANEYCRKTEPEDLCKKANPNSRKIMAHYSWDFAQQLHYPFEDQQVGPIFFKTPRRAQLFGVCNEGISCQRNYLIDEGHFPGKNANTVISLLDHFFANYGLGEKWVHLTADNCAGQNKNNALLQYLVYRVLTGLHDKTTLSFLIAGHTKFSPDGYFGLVKRHYRRSQVYTYEHLADIVEGSSKNGHNICVRTSGENMHPVVYRDWTSWLSRYFTALNGISNYHHFRIEKNTPSAVAVKELKDSREMKVELAKKTFPFSKSKHPKRLPGRLFPKGLSLKRQWYLYDQIRSHIPSESDKNKTCPMPREPRPKG